LKCNGEGALSRAFKFDRSQLSGSVLPTRGRLFHALRAPAVRKGQRCFLIFEARELRSPRRTRIENRLSQNGRDCSAAGVRVRGRCATNRSDRVRRRAGGADRRRGLERRGRTSVCTWRARVLRKPSRFTAVALRATAERPAPSGQTARRWNAGVMRSTSIQPARRWRAAFWGT